MILVLLLPANHRSWVWCALGPLAGTRPCPRFAGGRVGPRLAPAVLFWWPVGGLPLAGGLGWVGCGARRAGLPVAGGRGRGARGAWPSPCGRAGVCPASLLVLMSPLGAVVGGPGGVSPPARSAGTGSPVSFFLHLFSWIRGIMVLWLGAAGLFPARVASARFGVVWLVRVGCALGVSL